MFSVVGEKILAGEASHMKVKLLWRMVFVTIWVQRYMKFTLPWVVAFVAVWDTNVLEITLPWVVVFVAVWGTEVHEVHITLGGGLCRGMGYQGT